MDWRGIAQMVMNYRKDIFHKLGRNFWSERYERKRKQGLKPEGSRCSCHKEQSFEKFLCVFLNNLSLMCCTDWGVAAFKFFSKSLKFEIKCSYMTLLNYKVMKGDFSLCSFCGSVRWDQSIIDEHCVSLVMFQNSLLTKQIPDRFKNFNQFFLKIALRSS